MLFFYKVILLTWFGIGFASMVTISCLIIHLNHLSTCINWHWFSFLFNHFSMFLALPVSSDTICQQSLIDMGLEYKPTSIIEWKKIASSFNSIEHSSKVHQLIKIPGCHVAITSFPSKFHLNSGGTAGGLVPGLTPTETAAIPLCTRLGITAWVSPVSNKIISTTVHVYTS